MDTTFSIGNVKFRNPIMNASGTFGYGREIAEFGRINGLGAIIGKTIFLKARKGNPPPRVVETPSGVLNAIGLANEGLDDFLSDKLPMMLKLVRSKNKIPTRIIVSIGGHTRHEFAEMVARLDGYPGVDALELNVSCPNVSSGGMAFSQDARVLASLIRALRPKTKLPLIAKLSPNVTDIAGMARASEEAGADAVALVNTFKGMVIDIKTRRPALGNITGGLSGPAIKPLALCAVWQSAKAVKIPVIGIGGIMSLNDMLEFLLAGATAVQIGTANMILPSLIQSLPKELEKWLSSQKIQKLSQFVGKLDTPTNRD